MPGHVAVVTDSAACLPAELARQHGIRIVPLLVHAGALVTDDTPDALAAIEAQLRAGQRVSTSRPAPAKFAMAYAAAAEAGATAIVSVHLSGALSGTASSAALAADGASIPVRVVDSRSIGVGLGLVVLAAAAAAGDGLGADDVAAAASGRSGRTMSFFALDTAGHLRAAGRLDPAASVADDLAAGLPGGLPGGRLTARPLLQLRDGRISVLERVRTLSAAAARLEELVAEFAAGRPADLAVQHLGNAERAARLAGRLARSMPLARQAYLAEAGPAIRAHTGPGMLGVAVAPC